MKRRADIILLATVGVFVVGALLVGLAALRANRSIAVSLASLGEKTRDLVVEVRRERERVAAAERLRATLERQLANLEAARSRSDASARAEKAASPTAPRSMSDIISSDPKLELLELQRLRLALHGDYGYFIYSAELSPEQINKWEELYVKHSERWMDLKSAARGQDEAGKQTVAALQKQATVDYETALAGLLGDDRYRKLQDYEQTIPIRNMVVNGLAGAAALEGIPLTDQQGDQLMGALIASGGADVRGKAQDLTGIDWAAADAQARWILSPEQFALFKNTAPATSFSSRWRAQLNAAIRRAAEADAAAAAPKPPGR